MVFLVCACLMMCDTMLWISDILACTVRLSSVTIGSGTVGNVCWLLLTVDLLIVSNKAAIGRVKNSGFVEYALHSNTTMKSLPMISGALFESIRWWRYLKNRSTQLTPIVDTFEIQGLTRSEFSMRSESGDLCWTAPFEPFYADVSKYRWRPSVWWSMLWCNRAPAEVLSPGKGCRRDSTPIRNSIARNEKIHQYQLPGMNYFVSLRLTGLRWILPEINWRRAHIK